MVGGFALTALIIVAIYAIGRLTGHWLIPVGAVTALPLAISMVGWVEIALGIGFADLANRFDRGGILVKAGIIFVVLSLIGLYLWAGIRFVNSDAVRGSHRRSSVLFNQLGPGNAETNRGLRSVRPRQPDSPRLECPSDQGMPLWLAPSPEQCKRSRKAGQEPARLATSRDTNRIRHHQGRRLMGSGDMGFGGHLISNSPDSQKGTVRSTTSRLQAYLGVRPRQQLVLRKKAFFVR